MNLKQKKHLVSEIRGMNQGLKEIYESELHRKQESGQQSKAGQIKNEIKKILNDEMKEREFMCLQVTIYIYTRIINEDIMH